MIKIAVQDDTVIYAKMNGDIRPEVMALLFHLYYKDRRNYRLLVDSVKITEMMIDMEETFHEDNDME